MKAAYYNEIDPFAAQWLRNLISAGLIAPGDVDERSIVDVRPDDLSGYTQAHFFAGIGGWSYALRLAGWPDERPVWTGSCPCQDFSVIGQRKGFSGHRDLWPRWFPLIAECQPECVFGEQVDGAAGWIDRTVNDLESIEYACGTTVIPALAAGAQHERMRLYFVANPDTSRWTHSERLAAAQAWAEIRRSAGMVHRQATEHLSGPLIPDPSWIVDGLSGEGHAVSAYGNAIHAPLAAQFIGAAIDTFANATDD